MGNELDYGLQPNVISHGKSFAQIELRRYAMRSGRRDELIDLFERAFVESQERCGMLPIGHFRDLDDADSFVWLRAFPDAAKRGAALAQFYVDSSEWRTHRDAANATIVDSDNVLLLKSARPSSGFDLGGLARPAGKANQEQTFVAISICAMNARVDKVLSTFERDKLEQLRAIARRVCYFVTDERPNDFARLPVRTDLLALVVAGVCPTIEALDAWVDLMKATDCETLRLVPAPRSLFR